VAAVTVPTTAAQQPPSAVSEFLSGVELFARGLGFWIRSTRLCVLGAIPALISAVLLAIGLGVLTAFAGDIAGWATPFADHWSDGWRGFFRTIVAIAVVGAGGLIGVFAFTALTLTIGEPFYERISAAVEDRYGGVPGAVELSFWRSLVDGLRFLGLSILIGVPLFLAGFIPLIGQTVVPVVGAVVGGWLLAVELTGTPFERRGRSLAERRAALRRRRPLALGFGVCVFLCFLIPLGAVIVMPAAVSGATLLARRVLEPPSD
jgi:CysZ protein